MHVHTFLTHMFINTNYQTFDFPVKIKVHIIKFVTAKSSQLFACLL